MPIFKITKKIIDQSIIHIEADSLDDALDVLAKNRSSLAVYWEQEIMQEERMEAERARYINNTKIIKGEDL